MSFCCKTPFRDEQTARLYITKQRQDKKPRTSGLKEPYFCDACKCYHLRIVKNKEPVVLA